MHHLKRTSFIFLLIYLLSAIIGANLVWTSSYNSLLASHHSELDRFSSHISARLDKYAHLPQLLARDRKLIDALLNQKNSAQIDVTNRYLEQINDTIGAADTYLLNVKALTVAASNWNIERSFIGRNFAWRPYFQSAMTGKHSQYYALGSTSGQRGYYYSSPVIYAAETIGVVVVKMDLSSIEENWENNTSYFVATDPNNVIFMSSQPKWLFQSIQPLNSGLLSRIRASQQYLDKTIGSLGLDGNLISEQTEWINRKLGWIKGDFIVTSKPLQHVPLTIRVLTPKITVFWDSFAYLVLCTMTFVIAYLTLLLAHHRRLKQRQFSQLQSEAKQKLEFLVMERTAELHAEVVERTKAELQLRRTQDELVQAAKLAVLGQMSASISHELNNPLAAIRSFADNGRRFLSKEKYERTDENLQRISALTERMAKISTQLKSFARKSDGDEQSNVQLKPLILSAKELMLSQFKSNFIEFELLMPEQPIWLHINPIQLEQVLINLLTNAIQATVDCEQRQINLSVELNDDQVVVHIDDNGVGIRKVNLRDLFEPFFTTKKNGLGLGLSISQQIIKSMDGEIRATSAPLGGARFSLMLPTINEPQ